MERTRIIEVLLNAETESELLSYLFSSIRELPENNLPLSIYVDSDKFSFLKEMYPNVTLIKSQPDKQHIFFTEDVSKSILTFTFSFYSPRSREFNIGIKDNDDGVIVTPISNEDPGLHLYPYALCMTNKVKSFETFVKILRSKDSVIDIYVPSSLLIKPISYNRIQKYFKTIIVHNNDVQPVTVSDKGRTLNIHAFDGKVTPTMVQNSMKHVLLDYEHYQSFIDILSNFPDKIVWSSLVGPFFTDLKKYAFCGNIASERLYCYQLKKKFKLFKEIKDQLDLIIKLGIILPQIKDVVEIIDEKISTKQKINKLNKLIQ